MNQMHNRCRYGVWRVGQCRLLCARLLSGVLLSGLLLLSGAANASPEEDWQWDVVSFAPAASDRLGTRHVGTLAPTGVAFGTRLTFVPTHGAWNGQHLRLSLMHQAHGHRFPKPTLHLRPSATSFSANGATEMDTWSLQYVRVYGAWLCQGEFSGGLTHDGSEEAQFLGGYGALRWFTSGHSRRDTTVSGRFIHARTQSPGWELVLNYERTHGRQRDNLGQDRMNTSTGAWTLGGYWYVRPNLRLWLSLVTTIDLDHLTRIDGRSTEWIGRVHYDF